MPQNVKELYELLLQSRTEMDLPQNMQNALDISIKSFQIHRPIGKVMIVLMGQTGTGKSSTINNLFADPNLCQTNANRSQTHKVTEYHKLIAFSELKLKAYLSLVDTPGTFDTLKNNMTIIQEFKSKYSAFWTGTDNIVYPNLVLITVNAGDTRLAEKDSFFCQTLRTIQEIQLLDSNRVNLIVAATFAANISTNPTYFAREKKRIKNVISKVTFSTLGLMNVEIVFVENRPDIHTLQKRENCDFHELPDGEMTPLNLFRAICRLFKFNQDYLGSLITSRYFNEDCQEKKAKVTSKDLNTYEEPDETLNEILNKEFQKYIEKRFGEGNSSNLSDLQFAGFGYSLVDECTASCVRLNSVHPRCDSFAGRDNRIHKINFANVDEYRKYRLKLYGLDPGMELKFSPDVNSIGKWRNEGDLDHYISFVFEDRLETMIFGEELQRGSLVRELQSDLDNLPSPGWFCGTNASQNDTLRSFFDNWGTHYIKEVGIGGSMRVDCCIPSNWTEEQKREFLGKIQSKIGSLVDQEEFEGDFNELVVDNPVWIKFHGGIQPKTNKLAEVTPEVFAEWKRSLKKHPTELEYTIKLESYEVFLDEKYKKTSFREVTLEFLKGCPTKLTAKQKIEAKAEEIIAMTSLVAIVGTCVGAALVIMRR